MDSVGEHVRFLNLPLDQLDDYQQSSNSSELIHDEANHFEEEGRVLKVSGRRFGFRCGRTITVVLIRYRQIQFDHHGDNRELEENDDEEVSKMWLTT